MTRTRRQLAAALLTAVGGAGLAQTVSRPIPAAKLLPAVPVESTLVTRGYAPEPGTFGDTRPQVKTLSDQRSWTGAPLPADARRQPTVPIAAPVRQPVPASQPRPPAAPPAPAYASGTSGVYAGPPAYRWYGYGTTTPGANPLAPAGQYPRGSANWYAQTGATPGAFPIPVTAGGEPVPRFEPPAYAAAQQPPAPTAPPPSAVPTYPATARDTRPAPSFVPPASPPPSRPASTVLPPPTVLPPSPPPQPAPAEPKAPGGPAPIAVSAPPPAPTPKVEPPAAAPATPAGGLSWQAAPGAKDTPTFSAAKPEAPIATSDAAPAVAPTMNEPAPIAFKASQTAPAPTVAAESSPATAPPLVPVPPPAIPVPPPAVLPPGADWRSAPQARGQQPTAEAVSLTSQLRNACYGLATVAEVTHTGPTTLTVRLTAASDADARTAAAQAAKLPALRPYTVRFDVELAAR